LFPFQAKCLNINVRIALGNFFFQFLNHEKIKCDN
jgi:hypothetical protein